MANLNFAIQQHDSISATTRALAVARRCCAVAVLTVGTMLCGQAVNAQGVFRSPEVPQGQTIAGQRISRSQTGSANAIGPANAFGQVIVQKPSTSFLPPAANNKLTPRIELSEDNDAGLFNQGPEAPLESIEPELDFERFGEAGDSDDSVSDLLSGNDRTDSSGNRLETIRQRYPDGKTRLLRQVAQDAAGNYFNQGAWRVLSRSGDVVAEGQFDRGRMSGQWRRYHTAGSGGMFSTSPFSQFKGRFLSVASFDNGQLDGMWTIYDQNNQKIFEVPYSKGQRNGTATWWFPTATKMREATFRKGILDGKVLEWDEQNKLTRREEFIAGRRIVRNVSLYRPNQPSEVQFYLDGKLKLEGEDQWWDAQPAQFSPSGQRVQHGPIKRWYDNGQPKMQGQYRDDQRVGEFTWWHANGGRKLAAIYMEGQKVDTWTWWHENGMRSIQGDYKKDKAVGAWTWWDENGRVARQEDFDKINRDKNGASGELTTPTATTSEEDENISKKATTSIFDAPDDTDNSDSQSDSPAVEASEENSDQNDTDINMLLLDTDSLEEIDPMDNTPGELPDGMLFREPAIEADTP